MRRKLFFYVHKNRSMLSAFEDETRMAKTCMHETAQQACLLQQQLDYPSSSKMPAPLEHNVMVIISGIFVKSYRIKADCFSLKYGLLCSSRRNKMILIFPIISLDCRFAFSSYHVFYANGEEKFTFC